MRVFILTAVSFPYGMAPTKRITCYAKALTETGVECEVISFRRTENINNQTRKGSFEGVKFRYIGRKSLRPKNKLMGVIVDCIDHLHMLWFLISVLKESDVVFSYGSTYHFGNMLIMATHIKKAIFVRDLVEIPEVTSLETNRIKRIRKKELQTQFPRYDGVVAISDALTKLAEQYVCNKNTIIKVPILVEYDKYYLPNKSGEADVPYIFHAGTLTEQKDGFVGLVEAFGRVTQMLNDPLLLISTGTLNSSIHRNELKAIIKKYNLEDKLLFTGYLTEQELRDYLAKSSLVIINKYRTEQNVYCFSTKLGEYMAAGKPVIITNVGEAINWLTDGWDSIIIEPEDSNILADTIVKVMKDGLLRNQIGTNARLTCKQAFHYSNYGDTLKMFFEQLIKQKELV